MPNSGIIYTTSKILAIQNGQVISSGTSFYVKNRNQIYLVTCYHIVKECEEVKILLLSNDFQRIERNTITIQSNKFSFLASEDLAWVNITKSLKAMLKENIKLLVKTFDLYTSSIFNHDNLDIFESVYFIGYPRGIIDNFNLTPILRKSNFATIYSMNFNMINQFLIDAYVVPGSSGSPVFVKNNHEIILIGVIVGAYITNDNMESYFNLGIVSKLNNFIRKLEV